VFYDSILFHNDLWDDTESKIKYENLSQYFIILLGQPGQVKVLFISVSDKIKPILLGAVLV